MSKGDVLIFNIPTAGEVCVIDNDLKRAERYDLYSQVYLSIYGANREDDGVTTDKAQYWGNFISSDPNENLRSESSRLLQRGYGTRQKALELEQALITDLQWLIDTGQVKTIEPIIDIANETITITLDGVEMRL